MNERRLAVQGGCGQFDVAVDHDTTGHLELCACCSAPFSQPHRQALESSSEDNGVPSLDQGYGIDFCEGFGNVFDCV